MLKASLRFAWRSLTVLNRIALVGTLLLAFAFAGLLLALRYFVLPNIEHYRGGITEAASRALGQPISVENIRADWQGFRPHLLLTNVRILDQHGAAALTLQRVESQVAWTSLFTLELRLYSLELDQPDLLIKRDTKGLLYVAGVPLAGPSNGGSGLSEWLLNQSRIAVRDARITWQDEQRGVPPLVFQDVNLLIDNTWDRHRFALRALPPEELAAQIDVRGDFYGESLAEPESWQGELYTQLDYADVAAWRTWVSLPISFSSGKGALRGWLDVEKGKVHQVTADLALSNVRTRLAEDLPPLDLRTLRGRVGWHDLPRGIEVSTRDLSLRLSSGALLPPTDFYLRYAAAQDGEPASGEVRANKLDMLGLSTLAEFLPFDHGLKQKLGEFSPRGRVSDLYAKWRGEADQPLHYELRARFSGLSMRRVGAVPGFSGLTGEVDGSDVSGSLSLNARKLTVDAPTVMLEPLLFDALTAQVNWQSDEEGLEISLGNVAVDNADMKGALYGSYRTAPGSRGIVDLTAHLSRAAVKHVDRYIPVNALPQPTHAWLASALAGGRSDQVDFRLRGDLKDFPFPENKLGLFQIRARIRDGALDFAKDWPGIEHIDGNLLIEGRRLEVTASSASTVGNQLQKVSVAIPDLAAPDMHLQIYGEAAGDVGRAIDYVQASPVRGYIGGFTNTVKAHGNGMLTLALNIPLRGGNKPKVNGTYHFLGDEIDLGSGVPLLRAASGDLVFTESSVRTRDLAAQVLGGPATAEVRSSEGGTVLATASGTASVDQMRAATPTPLLASLHGGFKWNAQVTVQQHQADVVVTSNLSGLGSSLPIPFAKKASDAIQLRFERKSLGEQRDMLSVQYGTLLGARFLRQVEAGEWKIKRGTVGFGPVRRWLDREGIWVVGTVPQLSLEGWGGLGSGGAMGADGTVLISGADLLVQKATGFGQTVSNLRVYARASDGVLTAQLASKEMSGEVTWQPRDEGNLSAHLRTLALVTPETGKEAAPASAPAATPAGNSPLIEVVVDNVSYNGKQFGRLELRLQQRAGEWQLERAVLANPDGTLTGDGKWVATGPAAQTQVSFKLEIADAGRVLDRSGYPNSVKNGGGKLEGALSWRGGPEEFSYATLNGSLSVKIGQGRFLKIDPGVGKLLGILSLQALPQHIKLDFTDVFSEGFSFDSISGTALVRQGTLVTTDFKIDGSAAKVTMFGQVDLNRETQNLRIRVSPEVGGGVSLLGAFAAGPAVGVGVLIANKLLQEPLEKLVSFDYNVTGTWANPTVVKAGVFRSAK